jgi:hypothetical protein
MTQPDIDTLMSRTPDEMTAADIDVLVEYHRTQRTRRAAGERDLKPKTAADLSHILNKISAASPTSGSAKAVTITRKF